MIADIKQIDGYAEMTPDEIVTALQAIKVTNNAIDLGELLFLLNNRGMLVRLIRPADTGEKWSGTVVNMIMHVNENVPTMAGPVNQWFSHITNDRNNLFDTSRTEYGAQLSLLAGSFGGQPTMPTVEDFQAIADLGGGWKYADLTAEQVTAAIEADAKATMIANALDPLRIKLNNATASLGPEHVDGLTVAQLQTRIDAVMASEFGLPSTDGIGE